MSLKERTASILKLILASDTAKSVSDIAASLGLSTKTISRELPEVSAVLSEHGLTLGKKKGTGLTIEGTAADVESLRETVERVSGHSYSIEERRAIIVSQLLPNREPVKLFTLSAMLGVTDSTISNDLDKLDAWFKGHGLELVRRPGLGVYVEGEERAIRQAIIEYIYDNIAEQELLELVRASLADDEEKAGVVSGYLLDLVDKEIIHRLERLIREAERELQMTLSDEAFIGLVIHLALAVQRIRKGEKIHIRDEFLAELAKKSEYKTAERIGAEIAREFDITVTIDEVGYITMHLLGARSRYRAKESSAVMDNFHLVRLAKSIMRRAEERTGESLYRNSELLTGLVNHLGPSVSRLRMQMDIRNPLLAEMKERYPELMQLARHAVADVERELELKFPESELAFIAMHLSAALTDSTLGARREVSVIVACPTGMGTSRLLASRLRQEYAQLQLVDLVSTLQLTPGYFDTHTADIIISTVPIPSVPVPVVVVSPLLTLEDRARLTQAIEHAADSAPDVREAAIAPPDFKSGLELMAVYNEAILSLLNHFFFIEERAAMAVTEVAAAVGRLVGADESAAQGIARALLAREDQGSTAVTGSGMIMLHCRTSAVAGLRLGIVHLGEYFMYPSEPTERIRTAIVMLAPQSSSCYELETIGYIASILLERWGLIDVLHEGDERLIYEELVRIFREFYAKKYKELLEG